MKKKPKLKDKEMPDFDISYVELQEHDFLESQGKEFAKRLDDGDEMLIIGM